MKVEFKKTYKSVKYAVYEIFCILKLLNVIKKYIIFSI